MGIKGLYSCLKPQSRQVDFTKESPKRLALDVYPFLYKFKYDLDSCIKLLKEFCEAGHTCTLYMDGNPPKEKQEELALRKQQREEAYQQAEILKQFLNDKDKSDVFDEKAKLFLQSKIAAYEAESYSIKKDTRELFIKKVKEETTIPIVLCEGESDVDLIQVALRGEVDAVIANDMDLFVGGVERLWMLGKTNAEPLLLEFHRSAITKYLGLQSKSWVDIAILAGYEKTKSLQRGTVQQAIKRIKKYKSLENLFAEHPELLEGKQIQEFVEARRFF